jgi:hypothetical protein
VGIASSGSSVVEIHTVSVLAGLGGCASVPATTGPGITLDLPILPVLDLSGDPTLGVGSLALSLSNGQPDSPFAVVAALEPDFFGIPGPFLGEFVIALPFPPPFVSGLLSAAGDFALTIPLAGVQPSQAYVSFHIQGAALDPAGTWRLTNGAAVTLLP